MNTEKKLWNYLESQYKGKRIFITGHTGFKGSWLLKLLSMLGAEIKGYSLTPENDHNLYNLIDGDKLCHSIIADIRNKERLMSDVASFKPDFIFHLAAQPLVRLSYEIPVDTFEVNAIGTANLLEAIRNFDNPCYSVLITTDKVYHNNEWSYPYREIDRLGGYDPYSASKACAEFVIDSYRNSFFNIIDFDRHKKALAVARAGNVIGGGDWSIDRIIPDVVRALSKNDKVEIRNPFSIRPWQHVLEPILGYLILGSKLMQEPKSFSQAYNFGPNYSDALPVEELVKISILHWGTGEYWLNQQPNQLHEAGLLKLDISKAIKELHWLPKWNAMQAVQETINWYKVYHSNVNDIIFYTEKQIKNFVNL